MVTRLHKLFFKLFVGLFLTLPAAAQTLTISSAGNSGSYTYSSGILTVSANATINASTIVSWLGTSSLTILGATNAISVDVNQDIYSSSAGNGITIGNANSTGTVTFNNTVSLMGPLTVYANNIRMGSTIVASSQSAQLIAGGSSGSISLFAKNGFESLATSGTTRGKIMATGGGNIHINADTEANNSGLLNIDWLTFDSGAGNIILEASTYNWSTSSGVELPEFYGTGAFTFRNVLNANYSFNTAWIAIFQDRSELTLGSNTGSEEILLAPCTTCNSSAKNYTGSTLEIGGPINLYGSKVTIDLSIKSTAANADILLKAKNSILINASRTVTSNNGDITFWANADGTANSTEGDFIGIQNAVVINSANGLTNQASDGGTITMAGGTTTQTLASGTTVPTAYAYSNRTTNWGGLPPGGVNFGFNTAANGQQNSLSIYSGGGDIVIKGKSHSSSAGIQWFSGTTGASQIINSGNGTILFDGLGTSTNAHGIELNSYASSVAPSITSSSSSSTAIRFVGETSATTDRAGFQGAATLIANATGGGIEISGKTPSASTYGAVEAGGILTYALTGPITFIGDGSGGLKIGGTWGKGSLPSSSSNIVLRTNAFTFANPTIQTTGAITVEPFGNSFTNAISFPITSLSLPNTITGLTLGKSTNTSDITIASATTISGPVTLYGGNINLNQNINTSGATALGDILCKASGDVILAASRSITTSGGDIILWANSDNANSAGSVALRSLSSIVTGSNSVTGGHVWIGGGSNGGTWNSLAVGAGYAVPGTGFNPPTGSGGWTAGVFFESCSITTFGGDVKILGDAASSGRGLICFGTVSIQTNAGDIEIEGNATNSALSDVNGILFGLHDNLTIGNVSLSSSASGAAITVSGFGRGTENAIGLSGTLTALSTGTGNIIFNGTSYGSGTAIRIGNYYHGKLNAYAASGSITFNGGIKGLQVSAAQINGITTGPSMLNIGQGGGIASSSSPVIFTGDVLSIAADGIAVNTSGSLTIQPSSNSFTNTLTYPITSLTVANTITGLTLGKATNLTGITIGSATSIAGPIAIYGASIALSNALTSSNATTGNISLNGTTLTGSSTITLQTGRTLTFNLSSTTTFAGVISGTSLNVVKDGAGVLALTGSNTPDFATLTISAGTYRLNSNQQLTLSGAFTNNGTFVMSDGATFKPANSGTSVAGSGTFTVQKYLAGNSSTWNSTNSGRFWYMGIPVISAPRSSFGNYDINTNRLFSYNETTKTYTNITDNAAALSSGTGYVHRRSTNDTLTFTGVGANGLYGGDMNLTGLTRTSGSSVGFNLISNPYMAYLDWDAVTKTNVEPTYYLRSHNSTANDITALITYNASTGLESNNSSISNSVDFSYLAPLQAIWVRVGTAASTGSLAMTRSMLSHQSGNPGLKSSTIFPTLARVNLSDGARYDQMLVYLNQDMTNGVDQYDSEKMFASGVPQIYTMAAGKKLVMNGLNSNKKKISVPLYLELPENKVYHLQLADYKLEDGLILLEDKLEGTIQDFTFNDSYAFYANSGVLQNRFVLHFYAPDATITAQGPSNTWVAEEGSYTEGGNILISSDAKGKVQISLDQPETEKVDGIVQVTDANGRIVHSGALEGAVTKIELNVPSGIYYLTVQSGNMIENKKVFIQE